jgi:formylglycine-generating enzyme required for sulfatase activity
MLTFCRSLALLLMASAPTAFLVACDDYTSDDAIKKVEVGPLILEMKFVRVPKGTFWMSKDEKNAQRQVTIEHDFDMAANTVTQEQWQALMGNNPSWFSRRREGKDKVKDIADEDLKRFPVENMKWEEVEAFLVKLNQRERGKGWHYRLPSEAEWEYACRGAATTKEECSFDFYFSKPTNELSLKQANFLSDDRGDKTKVTKLERPQKVGSYTPNKLGLYDMHGNVWQWCSDLYEGSPLDRVVRGGSYANLARDCRAASRHWIAPAYRNDSVGFRLVRVPSASD